jgi:MFS family permease
MTVPFLLVYLHAVRGLSLAVAGLAVSTVALASLAGNLIAGPLIDRLGPRDTLAAGLVISAAGAALLLLVRRPWHAFPATATVGLGASIAWPAQDALLARLAADRHRSSVFSTRHATLNAGLGIGALIAATVVHTHRPSSFTPLYVADAVTFLAFLPFLATVPNPNPHPPSTDAGGDRPERTAFAAVLRDRVFVRVWLLLALVVTISYGQFHSAFPAFATRPGHIDARGLSAAYAANAITVVIAQLVTLRMLRGRARTTGVTLACGVWALAWTITLAAGQLGHGTGAVLAFAAALATFAVAETLLSPTFAAIVNDIAPDHLRGRYNGLSTLAWTIGFLLGPAIAGAALGAQLDAPLLIALIVACGAAAYGAGQLAYRLPRSANLID